MPALFSLSRDDAGQFRFTLHDERGDPLLQGPPFGDRASALRGIASVRAAAAVTSSYTVRTAPDGHLFFVLRTATLDVLGRSRSYSSPTAVEMGITLTREAAPGAPISDHTTR